MTKKGLGSGWVWPPIVTCLSCMASRSALWTFAGARLISSARTRLAKIGPRWGLKSPVFGWKTMVPDDVARQQVRRELDPLELDAESRRQGLDQQGLGQAGHPLEEHVAAGEQGDEKPFDDGLLADDGLADFFAEFLGPSGA